MASKPGGLNVMEWLQPRNWVRTEVAVRVIAECRLSCNVGKADVLGEETPHDDAITGAALDQADAARTIEGHGDHIEREHHRVPQADERQGPWDRGAPEKGSAAVIHHADTIDQIGARTAGGVFTPGK